MLRSRLQTRFDRAFNEFADDEKQFLFNCLNRSKKNNWKRAKKLAKKWGNDPEDWMRAAYDKEADPEH